MMSVYIDKKSAEILRGDHEAIKDLQRPAPADLSTGVLTTDGSTPLVLGLVKLGAKSGGAYPWKFAAEGTAGWVEGSTVTGSDTLGVAYTFDDTTVLDNSIALLVRWKNVDGVSRNYVMPLSKDGGITLNLYSCTVSGTSSFTCALDGSPVYTGVITELNIKSDCQVGDVRVKGTGPDVKLESWTLAVAAGSNWTYNSETDTASETMPTVKKPVTTIWFSNGLQGSGGDPEFEEGVVPDGGVQFTVTESAETRNDRGEVCGGKSVKVTGSVADQLLKTRWDPDPNDAANIQNPTKDIYFKNTSNGGTLPNKTQGITFTITKTPADRKIQVEAKGAIAMGDLANVNLAATPVDLNTASTTRYKYALVYDETDGVWVRMQRSEIDIISMRWNATTGKFQKNTISLNGFFKATDSGWEDTAAYKDC